MKQALKRTVARLALTQIDPGFRILLYHAVEESDPADRLSLRVSPDAFRAQMALLRDESCRVVPLASLPDGADHDADCVAITFDDGYASQLVAADILQEFGYPATFFLVPRFLSGQGGGADYWDRWGYMNWSDARNLLSKGFEVGSPSFSHPVRLTACTAAELEQEIRGSKRALETELGLTGLSFSYPHGMYNEAITRMVGEVGYRLACTSVIGTNRRPWQWFALRRTEISGTDGLADVQRKLQGKYDWIGSWHQWRAAHA